MTHASTLSQSAPDLTDDSYVVIGLATCFVRDAGEVTPITVIEPVPSAYLEALMKGVPTSYQSLYGVTLGDIVANDQPQKMPSLSDQDQGAAADFCPDFVTRALAAARTYQSRPEATTLVPVGSSTTEVNYSTERKRVLNVEHIVRAEDNVKQHEYTHKVL